ncbi:hypothetical protein Tco_1167766 [Tanacetum coccineum]
MKSSDEDNSTGNEDEEYVIAVRGFKFFRHRGKFVRQRREEKKSIRKPQDNKKSTSQRKWSRCGDPNNFIGGMSKTSPKAFLGGSWSDSGEDEEEFLALGWHLEEIHVTWAYLEKKQTRLRLYTKNHEELCIQSVETASPLQSDGVRIFIVTASEIQRRRQDMADLKRI